MARKKTAPKKPAKKATDKPKTKYQPTDEIVEGDATPAESTRVSKADPGLEAHVAEEKKEISGTELQDRQMRYRRNPVCPECGAHPTVCTSRRQGESTHRCRVCGHRWAVSAIVE